MNETYLPDTSTPQYMALEWPVANQDPANLTIGETPPITWENQYFSTLLWFSLGGEDWVAKFKF
jgi:hypothetical protein